MKRNLFKTIKQLTSKGGIEGYFAEKYDKFAKTILIDLYQLKKSPPDFSRPF